MSRTYTLLYTEHHPTNVHGSAPNRFERTAVVFSEREPRTRFRVSLSELLDTFWSDRF